MKKFTTTICCICFAIFGIGLAKYHVGHPEGHTLPVSAAQPIQWAIKPNVGFGTAASPIAFTNAAEEQQESLESTEPSVSVDSAKMIIDSLEKKIESLEKASVKTETRTASVPKSMKKGFGKVLRKKYVDPKTNVFEPDQIPSIHKAKQMGVKRPNGCIAVYELRQVDEICNQKDSLSAERAIEHDSGVHE